MTGRLGVLKRKPKILKNKIRTSERSAEDGGTSPETHSFYKKIVVGSFWVQESRTFAFFLLLLFGLLSPGFT